MQKLQDSVFSIVKTTNLSPAVFNFLQPSEDSSDKTPLGGILSDTKHGWLALGPKFCVVDLRTGLKVAARTFGTALSNFRTTVTSVVELPTPLTNNSQQLIISLECEDIAGMICVFHINGSQILRCIQTEIVVTELAVSDEIPDGPFSCFDGIIMAGSKTGEIFVFDLNRASLIQALKDISQGYEHLVRSEENLASLTFLQLNAVGQIETQRDLALENDDHIAVLLNENSLADNQYIFRNPDGTVRMKAKRNHIRVTIVQYIPQLGSLAVGFNFGAFQIWNLLNLDLEFTSQVNVECLPVTHFGFQEPCDDPRAFCYLWVVFSVIDRFDEEEFPLAVMYSLTYQGKRMLSDTKCLYQEFLMATVRFQVELSTTEQDAQLVGGRCVSCHTYSVNSMLGGEGEESMLNICQLVWECWGQNANSPAQYGMLMFDLDQWYKDQMPATYQLQSNAFMSATSCRELARGATATLDVRLSPASVSVYCAATRLEEHFYPNSLHYDCICLNTSEACTLSTIGIQRQIINSLDEVGPTALLNPTNLYNACVATGLVPLYMDTTRTPTQDTQRRYLLSVALEARLSRFLKRCAQDWAAGSHAGAGCTLTFLVDWCWQRAIELKENARELTAPLFTSSALPDRNVVRCLEHCVQQLTQLTGLLDSVLTKCCNLVVPDALSEMEEKYKGIGTVSLYFQVVQWFLRCGLLPEKNDAIHALPYPREHLVNTYSKRRLKLHRLQDNGMGDENAARVSCPLLYIDQLIEQEFGGDRIHQMWVRGGSECHGLYPPPSLYSLLRLYLLPDIPEEHKHSLVLYLLVDYSVVYDEVHYEPIIHRLMQFPTMFGLSNTAIKATQAFWHLDHRAFDFALDQLQCLTGNTLSEWQHNVVLSSLLAQKKTQAALQYLHVRKPAPIQNVANESRTNHRVNDHNKLEDWQSCCNLYLARGLVFEALDVIRMCVQNAGCLEDKVFVLNFFFKGCRNTGQLSKILQVTLLPFEEDIFIKYLENCNESQTSDILIMYYLQQARYLEAEQYNKKLKQSRPTRAKETTGSTESLADMLDREGARDTLVEVVCASLPNVANSVAKCVVEVDWQTHFIAPKPMSFFAQATSPKNAFIYKSSFIQSTIENASETWINKPVMRKGLKRALNIEETPFICTPKISRSRSIFTDTQAESTPPKRARLDLSALGTPKTPRNRTCDLSKQLEELLDMPDVQSPEVKIYERSGAETPHSILKIRHTESREQPSPVDSRYLDDTDDDMLETASNQTHYSDSTNKHLRFTIPTASESGSTPSPPLAARPSIYSMRESEKELSTPTQGEKETDISMESYTTTQSHAMNDPNPLESPPKKLATEEKVQRRSYKDSVRARHSLSISANSSLSEDPNTSMESIADIPITLINPRYSGERRRSRDNVGDSSREEERDNTTDTSDAESKKRTDSSQMEVPKMPRGRRGIRAISGESTPLINRSRSVTPERQDSPVITTPLRQTRNTRSRSRTPEISPRSSPLEPILEYPKQEVESEPHPVRTSLYVPRQLRSRSRTPERIEKLAESPRLEAITESPTKSAESPASSPTRRNLRERSRTPEVETVEKPATQVTFSTRTLRSRSKTPEKLLSPIRDPPRSAKKSLSRLVLESNAVKTQKKLVLESETEEKSDKPKSVIECTPMKSTKPAKLMEVTMSPITSKSVLQSSNESVFSETKYNDNSTAEPGIKPLPAFTMNETKFGKSVLNSDESSVAETSHTETKDESNPKDLKSLPAFTFGESIFGHSVLHSYESSLEASTKETQKTEAINTPTKSANVSMNITDFDKSVLGTSGDESKAKLSSLMTSDSDIEMKDDSEVQKEAVIQKDAVIQKEKEKIVEIEREIHEIEIEMSDSEPSESAGELEMSSEFGSEESEEEAPQVEDESMESGSEEESEEEEEEVDNDVISLSSSGSERLQIEEDTNSQEPENIANVQFNMETDNLASKDEEHSKKTEEQDPLSQGTAESAKEEESADPLNQGQLSLMTDDNSDRSEISLNYSDEKAEVTKEKDTPAAESSKTKVLKSQLAAKESKVEEEEATKTKNIRSTSQEPSVSQTAKETVQKSEQEISTSKKSDTDDAMVVETEKSKKQTSVKNKSSELSTKESSTEKVKTVTLKPAEKTETSEDTTVLKLQQPIPESNVGKSIDEPSVKNKSSDLSTKESSTEKVKTVTLKPSEKTDTSEDTTVLKLQQPIPESNVGKSIDEPDLIAHVSATPMEVEQKGPNIVKRKSQDRDKKADSIKTQSKTPIRSMDLEYMRYTAETARRVLRTPDRDTKMADEGKEPEKHTLRPRKRAESTSSNKSVKETEAEQTESTEAVQTPRTRKRSQSIASNKSEDKNADDKLDTPSRRRAKTPTSAEVRKILTRRASKEIEKLEESQTSILDESVTPKRRSTRARSRQDDNASVASESSVRSTRSTRSKASEDGGDIKAVRKGRKSILKPDLSAIPEITIEESTSRADDKDSIIKEYSSSRRLTRHQKSVLESWLEPRPSPLPRRRGSTASRSLASVQSHGQDDDSSSTHSGAFDVQPIDRISLMNRADFQGSPDSSEVQSTISPESIASDASKLRRSRLTRAASESQSTPKPARISRRVSVDIVRTPDQGSPLIGSPARGRRASFNRACEALHTPKGRRTSVDAKKGETDSQQGSPQASEASAASATPSTTPSRRSSRARSDAGAGKRSKKPAEEIKETKKK